MLRSLSLSVDAAILGQALCAIGAISAVLGVSLTPLVVLWAARRVSAALREDRVFTQGVLVAP